MGVSLSQLGEWLRVFRNEGLEALCTLQLKGDPGNLTPHQVQQLKDEVARGCFRNSDQIRHWIEKTFGVSYSSSGVKDLLKRVGVSYHKVTGFLWKADPDRQKAFVKKYGGDVVGLPLPVGRPAASNTPLSLSNTSS